MPVLVPCPPSETWQRFLLGEVSAQVASDLERHVQKCRLCGQLLPGLPADDTLVAALRGSVPAVVNAQERALLENLMLRLQKHRPAVSGDTTTGENTLGPRPNTDDSREMCTFLAPAESADELGRLGAFRVLKVLGHGGMGVVFQAEDSRLKRSVALKAMLPALAKTPSARERFLREARAAAALEHDHIVTIYHVGEEQGIPFLVMPLLKGMSLEDLLRPGERNRSGKLPLSQILKIGGEVAQGLGAAHEVGLIHRDIKPGNIWLEASADRSLPGRVKILDFGLARTTSEDAPLTTPGLIVGTPHYMAPEQAYGKPVDGRADLFSLGCMLYRMSAGRLPFQGTDAVATLLLVATESPPPLEKLDPELPGSFCDLVRRLMAKDPLERPPSAAAVADEIAKIESRLAQGSASSSPATVQLAAPTPARSRHRVGATLAAALLLIGAGAGAYFLFHHSNRDDRRGELPNSSISKAVGVPTPSGQEDRGDWLQRVARQPGDQQVILVIDKLKELNPGFDGKEKHSAKGDTVSFLQICTDHVTDISPLRALPALKVLTCEGSKYHAGKLVDIEPLRSMRVEKLFLSSNPISDLTALKGMPLSALAVNQTNVRDLAPLQGMKLGYLSAFHSEVADLTPLQGMPLHDLNIEGAKHVMDLSPLRGMPLNLFQCRGIGTEDLSPIMDMPLKELKCKINPDRDKPLLLSLKKLETINNQSAKEFIAKLP